jgi:phosphate transport system substrate-binding protein
MLRSVWGIALSVVFLTAIELVGSQKRSITVKGSDTMVILGQRWAEIFMELDPSVTIQVTGGGSGTGIAALVNGTTDVAEASRAMKPKEIDSVISRRGEEPLELPVAVDGIAVYVHERNRVRELSLEQLRSIYIGAITNWKDVGGSDERIIVYGRENNSGTHVYFKERVLGNSDYHPIMQTLPGTAAVIHAVAQDPQGIGFGGIAYAHGVKHALVSAGEGSSGVAPTLDNVLEARYPISRHLFWYLVGESEDVGGFAGWVLSPEGQSVVEKIGYYPLAESDRQRSIEKLRRRRPAAP